jgi:hypothetical protein
VTTTKPLEAASVVRRAPQLLSAEVGRELVLLHTEHNAYYDFDHIGAAIWHVLDADVSIADIVTQLLARFDVARAVCEADVITFLEDARREGLIIVVDADGRDL